MENQQGKIEPPLTNKVAPTRPQKINRAAAIATIVFSLIALFTVLSGYLYPPQPRETDEGAAAHIFQLSIAALFPTILIFLFTADWKQPARSAKPLLLPTITLVIAFTALFYLEHYR